MSSPRPILPNKYWLLTRRCVQRTFLMRPDEAMNNAFLYCLIEAALRFDVRLLLAQMLSNHHHVVLHDPGDHVVEFYHRFHTNLAKCINALRGRWENAFATEPPCLVELVDADAVLDKLVYTATNPVKDRQGWLGRADAPLAGSQDRPRAPRRPHAACSPPSPLLPR